MKLGLNLGFITSQNPEPLPLALAAERAGFDSVWVAEAWGSDAVSLLAWIGARTERIGLGSAVMQIPSRSPALTAMTAATLDRLSEGRFRLGLGVSGPQVIEGWHGVPYGKPIRRTREAIAIIRKVLERREPVEFRGEAYQVPLDGGTGMGKPLKLMFAPRRPTIPVYLAAIGPRNVALAAEIADGWLPIFFSPERRAIFDDSLRDGFARRPETFDPGSFDVAPSVMIAPGKDQELDRCRDRVKPALALYIGGMGAKGRNFYNDLARRYGYEEAARRIQELYLAGRKHEAIAAVPDELVDEVALCGSEGRIAEGMSRFREAGVTTLVCQILAAEPESVIRSLSELSSKL